MKVSNDNMTFSFISDFWQHIKTYGFDIRAKTNVKCGISAENHFRCCDFDEWLILEIVVMSAFFAILALGIFLHWLHPIHSVCDLYKPPFGPLAYLAGPMPGAYTSCLLGFGIPPPFLGAIPIGRKKWSLKLSVWQLYNQSWALLLKTCSIKLVD